jgi:hypothetical protein
MTEIGTKQNKLSAGSNISIIDGVISAANDGASSLDTTSNIITGTIDSGSITGRAGTTIQAPTITATSNLLVGTTNIITELSNKQPILNATNVNITTGSITSGSTIQAPTITATSNLFVGTTNIMTELSNKQQSLTQLVEITTGQINCGPIVSRPGSKIQGPIIQALDTLLIGSQELDVLEELNNKQYKLTAGSNITIDSATNTISASDGVSQSELDTKQDKLIAGDNITIDADTNIISSSGGVSQSTTLNIESLNVRAAQDYITISVPGQITCDSLFVGENKITSSSSLSLHQFQGFPKNTTDFTTITGLVGATNKWYGGVLAPNGKIYGIPYASTSVLIIDPDTNTTDTTTITGLTGINKWLGGILAPNGKIYGIPFRSTSVLIIDPETNTADTTTVTGLTGGWAGGVLHPNGKIYGFPSGNGTVLIFDPETNTVDTISGIGEGIWRGGVLAPNGKIYGVPFLGTFVLIIDPETNTVDTTTISGFPTHTKWSGGVLAPNGKIYCMPYGETYNVLIIDPDTNTIDTTSISGLDVHGSAAYHGGILAPNGLIYAIPFYTAEDVLVIDPETNTTETITTGLPDRTVKYGGGVLAPNGIIYCIPLIIESVLQIKTGLPKYPNWMLQAYFNKF